MTNTTSSPYLKAENIVKKFGDFTALNDVSLEIFESEFVCFLGPSGCGKTTLLRAIAGLDIQTAGIIEQAGKDISTLPPSERDFGIVFQSYALFPNLTVHRNARSGPDGALHTDGDGPLLERGNPRPAASGRRRPPADSATPDG